MCFTLSFDLLYQAISISGLRGHHREGVQSTRDHLICEDAMPQELKHRFLCALWA